MAETDSKKTDRKKKFVDEPGDVKWTVPGKKKPADKKKPKKDK